MECAEKHDMIDHYVFLAVASEVKVDVTHSHQLPTRWIDQGASRAIRLAKTPNRHIAGVIEVFLKEYFTDRTNWRAMLRSDGETLSDLQKEKEIALQLLPAELQKYTCNDDSVTSIDYPLQDFPDKVKSVSFDNTPDIQGVLKGIKGQYLIFGNDTVLNIRKFSGYYLKINAVG